MRIWSWALAIVVSAAGCASPPPPRPLVGEQQARESRAERLALAGRWAEALEAWAAVLRSDPFAYRAHAERARCFYHLGDYQLEILEYRKALAINPSYPAALRRLGHALLGQDALEEARAVYWRYLTLVPDDPRVLLSLSRIEAQLGDLPASARLLTRYRQVSPPPE